MQGREEDPNADIYFTLQEQDWGPTCQALVKPEWIDDPAYSTAQARQPHIFDIFAEIERWLADRTKYEAVGILRRYGVPCAPVLSMKEIAHDPALRSSGTVEEVEHKERGTYLTVGSPIEFTGFTPAITGSPLLGEHTDECWPRSGTRGADRSAAREEGRRLSRLTGRHATELPGRSRELRGVSGCRAGHLVPCRPW
ncbi:CoA transferase [Streptomyces sp. NPDC004658]|uniref:CoA transferase n=1 Tax=Streptomyces sp. NPDC004658 TaxID=3154672 RepID=UPI0033A029F9